MSDFLKFIYLGAWRKNAADRKGVWSDDRQKATMWLA